MLIITRLWLALVLTAEPQPIPNYDFQGDWVREHRGQPAFCISHNTDKWLRNCACKAMPADACGRNQRPRVKPHCKTECRKACYCEPEKSDTD